jgi:hypothetical protein
MDEPTKVEASIPEDQFLGAPCQKCGAETRHRVQAETRTHYEYADGLVDVWLKHRILQCQGCMMESFCREYQCSEETEYDVNTGQEYLPTTRTFYPTPSDARPEMHGAHHLPASVLPIYREALFASANDLPISAGFAIRAIIEAVCIDKAVPGRTLAKRIDGLASTGLITSAAAVILHNLRFMGNAAAHEMKAHSSAEISTAIDIAEILLQNVYVLPNLAQKLA